jgi:hypothetical protein
MLTIYVSDVLGFYNTRSSKLNEKETEKGEDDVVVMAKQSGEAEF